MDIATIIGLVVAYAMICYGIIVGGNPSGFIDPASASIVIGGTVGALLMNFPLPKVIGTMSIIKKTFLFVAAEPDAIIGKMVGYAERARREGMLALEEDSESEEDEFLRKGLRLAVDGTDPSLLEKILETDVDQLTARHTAGKKIMEAGGAFSPAFGMIGTLVGLVNMLASLEDPSTIGGSMAVALITTLYGAILANAFFLPLAGKLDTRSKEEQLGKAMIIDGIMAIQSGDSPRIVEEKLRSFLSPALRGKLDAEKEAA